MDGILDLKKLKLESFKKEKKNVVLFRIRPIENMISSVERG